MEPDAYSVDDHFRGKEAVVRSIYDCLIKHVGGMGAYTEEPKKTSIHLANGTAFAGIGTRRGYLLLNLRTDYPIESPRIHKSEQLSRRRFHQEIKLDSVEQIDSELLGWLTSAYSLSA